MDFEDRLQCCDFDNASPRRDTAVWLGGCRSIKKGCFIELLLVENAKKMASVFIWASVSFVILLFFAFNCMVDHAEIWLWMFRSINSFFENCLIPLCRLCSVDFSPRSVRLSHFCFHFCCSYCSNLGPHLLTIEIISYFFLKCTITNIKSSSQTTMQMNEWMNE